MSSPTGRYSLQLSAVLVGVRREAELTEVSSLTVHLLPGGENWSRTKKSTDTLQAALVSDNVPSLRRVE